MFCLFQNTFDDIIYINVYSIYFIFSVRILAFSFLYAIFIARRGLPMTLVEVSYVVFSLFSVIKQRDLKIK